MDPGDRLSENALHIHGVPPEAVELGDDQDISDLESVSEPCEFRSLADGDSLAWIQGMSGSVEEALRERAGRMVDSYRNR